MRVYFDQAWGISLVWDCMVWSTDDRIHVIRINYVIARGGILDTTYITNKLLEVGNADGW